METKGQDPKLDTTEDWFKGTMTGKFYPDGDYNSRGWFHCYDDGEIVKLYVSRLQLVDNGWLRKDRYAKSVNVTIQEETSGHY